MNREWQEASVTEEQKQKIREFIAKILDMENPEGILDSFKDGLDIDNLSQLDILAFQAGNFQVQGLATFNSGERVNFTIVTGKGRVEFNLTGVIAQNFYNQVIL